MRYIIILFLFILGEISAQNQLPNEFEAKVIGISDADTFKVLYKKQEIRIRLNHIDAPEKRQAYGTKAKQYASDLVFGEMVKVVGNKKDRYGRLISEIYIGNINVNKQLVRAGYAWHFKKYSKNKEYAKLEETARKNRVGLWQDKNPIAPWEWRENRKKK